MKNSLVSVVIPSYNRAKTLPQAISSVLTQSYQPVEIVVVDDCSSDNTKQVIAKMLKHVNNLKYIHLDKNIGEVGARNEGIKQAKGELVAFLDSDDQFTKNSLSIRVQAYTNSRYKKPLVYGDFILNGKPRPFAHKEGHHYQYLMRELSLCGIVAVLANRKAIIKAGLPDEKLPSWGDDDLIIKYAKHNPILHIRFPVAKIYTSLDSVSVNQTRNRLGCQMMVGKYHSDILKYHGSIRLLLWYIRIFRLRILELKSYYLKQKGIIATTIIFLIRGFMYILDKFLYLFFDNLFV